MAGSDTLVNHTYNSLSQGVSEQTDEARHESQVQEMVNCIPHLSRGVMRRNPVQLPTALLDKDSNPIAIADYYMYSYDRGTTGEQYVMLIGHRKWYTFNANTGALVGSYNDTTNSVTNLDYLDTGGLHPKDVFSIVTVGDHTWISNNTITTDTTDTTDGLSATFHKSIAVYTVKSTGNVVTQSNPSTGAVTLAGYKYTVNASYNDDAFAHTLDTGTITGNNTYKTGDSIATGLAALLNAGHVGATSAARTEGPTYQWSWYGVGTNTYVVKVGTTYSFYWNGVLAGKSTSTSITSGVYTYTLSGGIKSSLGTTAYYAITRERDEITDEDPLSGFWIASGPVVYKTDMPESATLEYNDSFGNSASYGFKGVVPSSDKLPDSLPADIGNVTVKVSPNEADEEGDGYWLTWDGEVWTETRAPGLVNTFDHTTMPHTFLRASDGTFSFGFYGEFDGTLDGTTHNKPNAPRWDERKKGDEGTAPTPGFIGKKINDMFVHNNRLGFLAEDAVVLSELSRYSNFWPTTIRSIPATDPIDLIVATTDVTGLRKAVSLSGLLLLFSDEAQFSVTGGGGALTPESATINPVSSYNYSNKAPARVLGNKVMFTTESGNGTQIFSFSADTLSTGAANLTAENVSLHVPTYLPTNINYIQTHSILGYLFMYSPDDPYTLYVLNTLDINRQTAQTAFHRWTFEHPITGISVLNNQLILGFNISSAITLTSIALDVPADVQSQSYLDEYSTGVDTSYDSYVTLSKWYIKDGNGFGNKRGRLQIRTAQFSVGYLDSYKIEIFNDSIINPVPTDEDWVLTEGLWDDNAYWSYNMTDTDDTTVIWKDALPFFSRIYYNDEKVTITSNSANTFIRFSSNENESDKGFTLSTVNLEGLFRQRSTRY